MRSQHVPSNEKTPSTHLVLDLLSTAQQTSSPRSNETCFLTLCSVSRDCRSLTNLLMLSTGCLCKIYQQKSFHINLLPLKVKHTQQRLVGSSTSSNDTNQASCTALDDLLCAGWELDTRLA